MMYLKYPEPELQTVVHPGGVVFFLPPQGKPGGTEITQPHLLRLRSHLNRRLGKLRRVVCQPQRVGMNSSVAVTLEGDTGKVYLLVSVGGHECWPSEEEYTHLRWYIQVVDAADLLYLLLWLNGMEAEK